VTNITTEIDEFIAKEGNGNIRDALNVALAKLEYILMLYSPVPPYISEETKDGYEKIIQEQKETIDLFSSSNLKLRLRKNDLESASKSAVGVMQDAADQGDLGAKEWLRKWEKIIYTKDEIK
jgi:hypothetical protein